MAIRSYTSRRELEEYSFSPVVTVAVPLTLIVLQSLLPAKIHALDIIDLPLLAVVFFSVARRNPIAGAFTGAFIGLMQDLPTGLPIGINGIAKSVVGYAASSIGVQVDVENLLTRVLMNFIFSLLQSVIIFIINRFLLGHSEAHVLWLHELIRAAVNTALAIPLFMFLDRFKRRD